MTIVRVLIVGTADLSAKSIYSYIEFDTVNELKQILKTNNISFLFKELNEIAICHGEYFSLKFADVKKKYPEIANLCDFKNLFASEENKTDLGKVKNKYNLVSEIYDLWPSEVTEVRYTTIDMLKCAPEDIDYVNGVNKRLSDYMDIKISYIRHYRQTFQNFINTNKHKYDIIWFMGCTNPHYVINISDSYIKNFKNSLTFDGIIAYTDGWVEHDFDKLAVYGFKECFEFVSHNTDDDAEEKIDYLLNHLTEIYTGIYSF